MYDPITVDKVNNWRQRAAEGTLSLDEMREIVNHLRADRRNAAVSAAEKRKREAAPKEPKTPKAKSKAAPPSGDDLLKELEGF